MAMRFHLPLLLVVACVGAPTRLAAAFFPSAHAPLRLHHRRCRGGGGGSSLLSTTLFGRAVKRGKLASNVSPAEGGITSSGEKRGKARKGKKSRGSGSGSASSSPATAKSPGGGISSSLAEWAATVGDAESVAPSKEEEGTTVADGVTEAESAASFSPFPEVNKGQRSADEVVPSEKIKGKRGSGGGGDRRSRQAERRAADSARRSVIRSTLSDLGDVFDPPEDDAGNKPKPKPFDLEYVMGKVRTLVDNPSSSGGVRVLSQGAANLPYRMVWAGSDDAVCHLGTGLHKVPLARLQEVFVILGQRRVEVLEVIRILGPFPNVRNTLQGDTNVEKPKSRGGSSRGRVGAGDDDGGRRPATRLQIKYDSMIDGTGKEILPPNSEDGVRRVDLDVLYADEDAMVCAVPWKGGEDEMGGEDPLTGDGSSILLFFRESDLDKKLEQLRVS